MAEWKKLRRQRRKTRERGVGVAGKFWLGLCQVVFYPLTLLLSRTRLLGAHNVPAEGPALLVFNHVSHLDPIYDAVNLNRATRFPRFMAKSSLWNVPVLKNVLTGCEQVPIYRGTADVEKSLRAAHDALENDKAILIYPDGTITKDPQGWPMTPKVGVARLALEHDVPVIPAARWGTRDIYDHYEKKFRPFPRKQVTVKFGEALDLSEYRGKEVDNALLREVSTLAMTRVRELLADIREVEAPAEFFIPARREKDQGSASDA